MSSKGKSDVTAHAHARAEVRVSHDERECCLKVLDSVTSTPQWIRQPKPRDCVHDVCVFVCKCVPGSPRASQPLNIRLCLLALRLFHFASCHQDSQQVPPCSRCVGYLDPRCRVVPGPWERGREGGREGGRTGREGGSWRERGKPAHRPQSQASGGFV